MTLNTKSFTNIALLTLMIGLAVWASWMVMQPTRHVVGVVEVGEVQ